jgi:hypothetical protein
MKERIIAEDIGVDAGMIIVADMSYFNDISFKWDGLELGKKFELENGFYKVKYNINNTWNGPIEGVETIEIISGEIVVIDPCYIIKDWNKWLNKTDYGDDINSDSAFIIDSMGGDGVYDVKFTMENIERV